MSRRLRLNSGVLLAAALISCGNRLDELKLSTTPPPANGMGGTPSMPGGSGGGVVQGGMVPQLVSTEPSDGAIDVDPATTVDLTFDRDVQAGLGDITVHRVVDGSVFESAAVDGSRVTFQGPRVTVDLAGLLGPTTSYYVNIAPAALVAVEGEAFPGISDPNRVRFTTLAVPLPGGISPSLYMWLDASYAPSVEADGGEVQFWRDRSGNVVDYEATGAGPATDEAMLNELNVLSFASNERLAGVKSALDNVGSFTVFLVAMATGQGTDVIWSRQQGPAPGDDVHVARSSGGGGGGGGGNQAPDGPPTFVVVADDGTTAVSAEVTLPGGQEPFVAGGLFNLAASITARADADVDTELSNYPPLAAERLSMIGSATNDGGGFAGVLAELVIYSRLLEIAEVDAVESALAAKWGIPVGP